MSWLKGDPSLMMRRIRFKGTPEEQQQVLSLLDELGVDRKTIYTILKYFELTPEGEKTLRIQFPDV